jgi:hypothetical protein
MNSPPDTIHARALRLVDHIEAEGILDHALRLVDHIEAEGILDHAADTIRRAIRTPMPIPANIARCPGEGSWEDGEWDWREGCEDCLRRTSPGGRVTIKPPAIIAFECEHRIRPGEVV